MTKWRTEILAELWLGGPLAIVPKEIVGDEEATSNWTTQLGLFTNGKKREHLEELNIGRN